MPDALGRPPSPRTALFWNGTAWQWARVDADGHIQIDVLSTAMDPLAATEATLATRASQATLAALAAAAATAANQATMITALQLIDNLVVALGGPGNVRLQVRGEDQHFSIDKVIAFTTDAVISGAGGWIVSAAVPAGYYWVVTNVTTADRTTATTQHNLYVVHDAVNVRFAHETAAFGVGDYSQWRGHVFLDPLDSILAEYVGGLAADNCRIHVTGYQMTLET